MNVIFYLRSLSFALPVTGDYIHTTSCESLLPIYCKKRKENLTSTWPIFTTTKYLNNDVFSKRNII